MAAAGWGAQRWDLARQHSACDIAAAAVDQTWNDDVARAIGTRIQASGLGYAVDTWARATASIDRWTDEWSTATRDVCVRGQVDKSLDARAASASTACLEEQRARLDRFLAQLAEPRRDTIARITGAVARIPSPTVCVNSDWLARRPADPTEESLRSAVVDTRHRMTQAGSFAAAGEYAAAIAVAAQAKTEADTIGWLPLRAAASYQLGAANADDSRLPAAREHLAEAFYLATEAGHDELALRAATMLVFVVGYRLAQPEPAERWRRLAESLVRRLGVEDHPLGATLRTHSGVLLAQRGQLEEALTDYHAALAVWEREVGEDHPQVVNVLAKIGAAHSARGEHDEALQAFVRGLEIRQRVFGPGHPAVADAWHNLGAAQFESGAGDDALASLKQALSIERKALPLKHPDIAGTLNNIANVLSQREQYDEAIALFEEALTIKQSTYGPKHREIGLALSNLAVVHGYAGDDVAALEACDEALRILESSEVPPTAMAKTDAAMANVLWRADQPARAVELARRARRTLRKVADPEAEEQLARVQEWLATHRAPGQGVEEPEG